MSYITAYTALCEPIIGRLPIEESIESLYDHVDEFAVYDCSKYDNLNLRKYNKVRKHIRGVWNPFDNPFGSMFTQALRLVDSDTALFLDIDEIFDFKKIGLQDLIQQFPLSPGGPGIAFSLRNYYCSRNFIVDGCSSKGPHVFKMHEDLIHDALGGHWEHYSRIRRSNKEPDSVDGVRLCSASQGVPLGHYQPIDPSMVLIHHTSHLDPVGKHIRSIVQFNHTSVLDLKEFYPFDMRVRPKIIQRLIKIGEQEIRDKKVKLWGEPKSIEYESNKLLEKYIERVGIIEFDPTTMTDYERYK